ncbi:uncharacterized protein LOC143911449 [Arctopsyche grandis]|uniref:uncharacterized protein LOC143911449 n=1 Tax=Arctopsyche grandis TaxID=121162 RepID=UPI00406D8CD3
MKFTVEIECDEENFTLNNLDWLLLEGGSYSDLVGDNTVENGNKLFTYVLKWTESKNNVSDCNSKINIGNFFESSSIENTSNMVDSNKDDALMLLQNKIIELVERIDKLENRRVQESPDVIPISTPKSFPPPPPPLPTLIPKKNEVLTPQSKSDKMPKKSLSPTSIITLDDLKNVKLKKRTEIFYTSKICPTILNIS